MDDYYVLCTLSNMFISFIFKMHINISDNLFRALFSVVDVQERLLRLNLDLIEGVNVLSYD